MSRSRLSNPHLLLWLLFAVALLLRVWGLAAQPPLDDEVASAFSADNYVRHGILGQVMWYHPPLRNWVLHLTSTLFGGYSVWGLRFGSVFLGSLSVPLAGYCALALFGSGRVAVLAAFFLAVDPLHIGLSREAVQEAMTPCFILAGVLAAAHGCKGRGTWLHYLAGLMFGLASASKWHGLFPWALCALVSLLFPPRRVDGGVDPLPARAMTACAAYLALPVTVYVATYLPWLLHGHSLLDFAAFQRFLVSRQYHHEGPAAAVQFVPHRAYHWFIWPVPWNDFVFYRGKAYLNIAMGNFLVWVMTLPALAVTCRAWLRERSRGSAVAIGLFLISYLPLVLTSRDVWVFSAPAVIPFAFMLTACAINLLMEQGRISVRMLSGYLVAVSVVTLLMYPLVTFRTLEYGYTRAVAEFYNPHPERGH